MDKNSKKILFVTGTRADFGKLQPLASEAHNRGFKICFFVTGMHMLKKYGLTKIEVQRYKEFECIEYINQREGDSQDIIISKTILGFSDLLQEIKPDLVVIHGDRIEALACSLVCSINHILSVHIEGGELSGTIDEVLRHCNTKLCSKHMVSSQDAKKRVQRLGESEEDIYVIGSPELDIHSSSSGVTLEEVKKRYEVMDKDYGICIFHPVTSEIEEIAQQAKDLFEALSETKKYFVVILPNNDPGSNEIKNVINKLNNFYFRVIPSMRFNCFSELMKNTSIFIGNSSAGVREAPFLGVPSIDIGSRQTNRAIAESVSFAKASDKTKIINLVNQNWNKRFTRDSTYGFGNASRRFVEILENDSFWKCSMQKYFTDSE